MGEVTEKNYGIVTGVLRVCAGWRGGGHVRADRAGAGLHAVGGGRRALPVRAGAAPPHARAARCAPARQHPQRRAGALDY